MSWLSPAALHNPVAVGFEGVVAVPYSAREAEGTWGGVTTTTPCSTAPRMSLE